MRWLRTGLLALALILLPATVVRAATSAGITITAMGYICEAPGGFTVTYINDYEVGLSWAMGADANNTMVRAAYGRTPENRTDGYLVYYGGGTYCNDTAVNFDETASLIYYRAWSQNAGGAWETVGSSGFMEGIGMKLIAVVILCLTLMGLGFWRRNMALFMAAMLAWIGFAFWNRTLSDGWGSWDLYEVLFFVGFSMALICLVEAVRMNIKPPIEEEEIEETEAYADNFGAMMEEVSKLRRLGPRRR